MWKPTVALCLCLCQCDEPAADAQRRQHDQKPEAPHDARTSELRVCARLCPGGVGIWGVKRFIRVRIILFGACVSVGKISSESDET